MKKVCDRQKRSKYSSIFLLVLAAEFGLCCIIKYMVLQFQSAGPILVFYGAIFIFVYQRKRWAKVLYYLTSFILLFTAIYAVMGIYLVYWKHSEFATPALPIFYLYLLRFPLHLAGNVLCWRWET